MDLAAVNIQRGRDHGIPGYTAWREPCGLSPIRTWVDLEPLMNFETIQRFRSIYDHVDDIDLYPGGLAERPIRGGVVGPTFGCIIAQQFANLRKGDRFWYENGGFENSFTPAQLQQIRRVTFGQVLCQVLPEIESVQPFVFLSPDNFRNSRFPCDSPEMESLDLRAWEERRLAQSQLGKPPPPPPVIPIQVPPPILPNNNNNNNNNVSPNVNVNGKLDDLEGKVEFINGHHANTRPQTHLAQKVDSKLDFDDGIKLSDKLTKPDKIDINDNLDFSSGSNSSKGNRNKNKDKLQIKPQTGVNDKIDFNKNEHKHKISDKLKLTTTTKKTTDVVDFDVIFLTGTNKSDKKKLQVNKDIDIDEMFDLPESKTKTDGRIIKRSADDDPEKRESYEVDEFLDELIANQDADNGRKHVAKKRRKKPAKVRPITAPKTTTKRTTVYFQNRPMVSDFYNPLKIKVTNITTSTIDLDSDDNDNPPPPFSLKPQLHTALYQAKPTFTISNSNPAPDKTKPVTFYHTTRRPLTYDQDEYYVLHPTINKPNRHKLTPANYGTVQKLQAATTESHPKSPDYQVNINIHLVSSTPKTDILLSDKLSNPNVHEVDGSYVNYEQIKPSNGYYQYSTKRPSPVIPIRTTTQRPDYYRPRPTQSPSSQSYYYQPTTYNYDRFEDRPFSTSKRPYIYRPSESFLAMFEEMHQNNYGQVHYGPSVSTRPTYISSYVDKVTKRPQIPSYLYYDGKYFNEKGQQQSQYGSSAPAYLQSDSFYISHAVQNPSQGGQSPYDSGEKNFVKISSVLGNRYLHKTDKEHYIHTAQQKDGEIELDSVENATVASVDIEQRAVDDANINLDAESVEIDTGADDAKLQIDIIPRESRQDDWVLYESEADIAVMDEPEMNPMGERVADELPKPMSEFWKKHDDTTDDNADGRDKLDNPTRIPDREP